MRRRYANPPIIEAVCELRPPADAAWDLAVPGLVYDRVKQVFPTRDQFLAGEVQVAQAPGGISQRIRAGQRVRFLQPADKGKASVQVGLEPPLLAVNCLPPYPGWEGFRPKIQLALTALTETVDLKTLHRIGLRYVNRIEIPEERVDLDRYFEFRPYLGGQLPQDMGSFIVGCVLPFRDAADACKIQLTGSEPGSGGAATCAFVLDLDYFVVRPPGVSVGQAMDWVDSAHDRIEELFEGCISDAVRGLLVEVT
jgi:uncharacterized protein (TIGR04255 family)